MINHLKANWKKYALTGIGLAALYYGVDPELAKSLAIKAWMGLP